MSFSNRTTVKGNFERGDKPTEAQFVDFIDTAFNIEVEATFADINTANYVSPVFIFVQVDETNSNEPTMYFYDGTNINWVVSQTV